MPTRRTFEYDATNLPPGLFIGSTTGLIEGTLEVAGATGTRVATAGAAAVNIWTVIVLKPSGARATAAFTPAVARADRPFTADRLRCRA